MNMEIESQIHGKYLEEYLHLGKHKGERGHLEYDWSKKIEEMLVQLNFQLVRENNQEKCEEISRTQKNILSNLISQLETGEIRPSRFQELITMNYKMVAYTRDIHCGKGEQKLSFILILEWYDIYPSLTKLMLKHFFMAPKNLKPLGSWKDVKYFCEYCLNNGLTVEHPLIKYVFNLTVEQLVNDMLTIEGGNGNISLVAKWIPREQSKRFGWIFQELSFLYFHCYLETAKTFEKREKALLKCKTAFRKLISYFNKKLDTVQINQCSKKWSQINFEKLTPKTMFKQTKALLNLDEQGEVRTIFNDRIECAKQFEEYIVSDLLNPSEKHKKNVNLLPGDLVKRAFKLLKSTSTRAVEVELLNLQWKKCVSQVDYQENFKTIIPIVDMSSAQENQLYHAIGLSCLIAEKSVKRILFFSSFSHWMEFEACGTFFEMIEKINEAKIIEKMNMNSNFHDVFEKIVKSFIEIKSSNIDVQQMSFVIISDMQIDSTFSLGSEKLSLYENIHEKFSTLGKYPLRKNYKPPHILFWNMRRTNGFPALPIQYNLSMLSGYHPVVLNKYLKKSMNDTKDTCNSWFILKKQLNQKRYDFLEEDINKELFYFFR